MPENADSGKKEKKYFLLKLIAPRPDFADTMTAAEL